jgi:hypothetical protein
MRLTILLVLFLALPSRASAQLLDAFNVSVLSTGGNCDVDDSCAQFQAGNSPSLTLQVSGTFTGTLTFEATSDGVNWLGVALTNISDGSSATTTTTTGTFAMPNPGILRLRARATAWASGSARVTATRGWATAKTSGVSGGTGLFSDGTAPAPAMSFASDPDTGLYRGTTNTPVMSSGGTASMAWVVENVKIRSDGAYQWSSSTNILGAADLALSRGGAGILTLSNAVGSFNRLQFGGTTSAFGAIRASGGQLDFVVADASAWSRIATGGYLLTTKVLIASELPTIASGFGTSPSVVSANGPSAMSINVGTGGVATSGVVTLVPAITGWICHVNNFTAAGAHVAYNTRQIATTTTSVTLENQTTSTGAAVAWAASDILRVSCFGF